MSFQRFTELEISYGNLIDKIKVASNSEKGNSVAREYVRMHKALFSIRTRFRIQSLRRLIHELEKREIIAPTNVAALSDIVKDLELYEIQLLYENHRKVNKINNAQVQQGEQILPAPFLPRNNYVQPVCRLPDQVRKLIAEQIGRRWTELARHLGMPDAEIDEVEAQYIDNWRRVHTILSWFESREQIDQRLKLMKALAMSRRRDLSEQVAALC